jgi:hypothetical protein
MSMYRMQMRRRYYVCDEPNGVGGRQFTLYRQTSQVNPSGFSYLGQPQEVVQQGIEDFQVSARVYANSGLSGTDCFLATGTGQPYCMCNQSTGSACDIDATLSSFTAATKPSWVSGLDIALSVVGSKALPDPLGAPLTVNDHIIAMPTIDGRRRMVVDANISLNNLTQVFP